MKVLLGTNHYFGYTGSETFAQTVALGLRALGHEVHLYAPYAGGSMVDRTQAGGVPVFSDLGLLGTQAYDLIHVSHNTIAFETRLAFPDIPMVFQSHGVLPFLEQPPPEDLGIARFLAVSEEVRDHLHQQGVPLDRIEIFRNCVDARRFRPETSLRPKPQRLLVISERMDSGTRAIVAQAAQRLQMQMRSIGEPGKVCEYPEQEINQADIVLSLGRGIIEAMACGRAALVYDYLGGDGMVTPENIDEIQKCNFSGRRFARRYTVEDLVRELEIYSPEMGRTNRRLVEERFSVEHNLDFLLQVYQRAIQGHESPSAIHANVLFVVNSVREARTYQASLKNIEIRAIREEQGPEKEKAGRRKSDVRQDYAYLVNARSQYAPETEAVLSSLASSRAWKLMMRYYQLRDGMLPPGSLRRKMIKFGLVDFWKSIMKLVRPKAGNRKVT
jgi:O-antigen biosynthesis protein